MEEWTTNKDKAISPVPCESEKSIRLECRTRDFSLPRIELAPWK